MAVINPTIPITSTTIQFKLPKEILEYLDVRPGYAQFLEDANFYMNSYLGGRDYKDGNYLRMLPNEKSDHFSIRKDISVYENHCKRIVNNYVSKIMANLPKRVNLDDMIEIIDFMDVTRRVIDINTFWRLFLRYIMILGECYALISHPKVIDESGVADNIPISNKLRKSKNIKYHVKLILPIDIPCIVNDVNGNVEAIVIKHVDGYTYIDNDIIVEWVWKDKRKQTIKLESEEKNHYGFVPVVKGIIDLNADEFGESVLSDIADNNKLLFNLRSIKRFDFFINGQIILMLPMTEDLAENKYPDWGYIDEEGNFKIEGKAILPVDPSAKPGYLVKDLTYHDKLDSDCERIIESMDRMANITVNRLLDQSGISKKYDYDNENTSMQTIALIMQYTEMIFWNMFLGLSYNMSLESKDASVIYHTDFDAIDKGQKIRQQIEVRSHLSEYKEFRHESAKKMVRNTFDEDFLPNELNDIEESMDKEYENNFETESQDDINVKNKTNNNNSDDESDNIAA